MRAASSFHRRAAAFWNLLSDWGRSVGVIGWWGTWPAEAVNGIVVSDRLGLAGRTAFGGDRDVEEATVSSFGGLTEPADFITTIVEEIGIPGHPKEWSESELFPFERYPIVGGRELGTLYGVLWQDELYVSIAEHVLQHRTDLEVTAVYLQGVDALAHHFWHFDSADESPDLPLPDGFSRHREILDRYYERVDKYLGSLLSAAGPEVRVVVASDHGFRLSPEGPFKADHSGFGVLLLSGQGVRPGRAGMSLRGLLEEKLHGPAEIFDVLPTVFYWLGLPVADDLDGRVLYRFFDSDFRQRHSEVRTPTYGAFEVLREPAVPLADEADHRYFQRLEALGYTP